MKQKPLKISWRAWCLDRLAKRDYSAHEMRQMMERRASASDQEVDADSVVEKLVQNGFVDDERYVENQIAMHTGTFGLKGPRELEKKFRIKGGITTELISRYIDPEDQKWYELARAYCFREFSAEVTTPDSTTEVPIKKYHNLKTRLYQKGFTRSQIDFALESFKPVKEVRSVEDPGVLERLIEKRMSDGRGPYDIVQYLKQKGFQEADVREYLQFPDEVWVESAARARQKRFGSDKPKNAKEKRKQIDFLKRRGFNFEHINQSFD